MDDTGHGPDHPDGVDGGQSSAPDGNGRQPPEEAGQERTERVRGLFDAIPFHESHGVELLVVTPRRAETKLPFEESLVGNPDWEVIHGGVISSLVDLTGAAVFMGQCGTYTPTVNLRVDYLEAAGREPLYANATVERAGESIGVARVEVESGEGVCATGTGVYRLVDDG